MALSSSFDITILGTDMPALIFGALAAKKGYRVLVTGQHARDIIYEINGVKGANGFRFVSRPQLIYGLHSSSIISDCFNDLVLGPEMRNRPKVLDPIIQLVMPGIRLDMPVTIETFEKELKREFPRSAGMISALIGETLQDLNKSFEDALAAFPLIPPKRSVFSGKKSGTIKDIAQFFEQRIDELSGDKIASVALQAIASGAALSPLEPGSIAQARVLWHIRNGLYHFDWGLDGIRNTFSAKIRDNTGDLKLKEAVDEISAPSWFKQKIDRISLTNGDNIGTGLVVIGTDPMTIPELLKAPKKAQALADDLQSLEPSHYLFTLNLGMPRNAIPDAMAKVVFHVLDPGKPLDNDNFLIIQQDPAMPPINDASTAASISVTAFMRAKGFDGTPGSLIAFGKKVITALTREILPFLRPERTTQSIAAIRKGPDGLTIDRHSLLPLYPSTASGLGLFSRPVYTRHKNLLNLSAEVMGNLGFEGAFYTAREALNIATDLLGDRGQR